MSKPLVICICGTDTDAGKTVVTAGLLAAIRGLGVDAGALKPVQTGCFTAPSGELLAPDVLVYRQAAPDAPARALVCLEEACSPHLAAARAGKRLDAAGPGGLADKIAKYAQSAEVVLVEAAGGLLAPLNESESMADLFSALARRSHLVDTQIILVAANRLGAVNHALLSLEALRSRGLNPAGVIMCNTAPAPADILDSTGQKPVSAAASGHHHAPGALDASGNFVESAIRKDNSRIISEQGRVPCLAELPYLVKLVQLANLAELAGPAGSTGLAELTELAELAAQADLTGSAHFSGSTVSADTARSTGPDAGHYSRDSYGRHCSAEASAKAPNAGLTAPGEEAAEIWAEISELLRPAAEYLLRWRGAAGMESACETGEGGDFWTGKGGGFVTGKGCDETRRLLAFDREHLWHPYTSALEPLKAWEARATGGSYIQLRYAPPSSAPARTEGATAAAPKAGPGASPNHSEPFNGPVLDGMSSWWAAVHGYNHPDLMSALHRQARVMPHVMFGGITHEPAVKLCERLLALAPSAMEHVFLADSGSVSVEVAMKMAVQYQRAISANADDNGSCAGVGNNCKSGVCNGCYSESTGDNGGGSGNCGGGAKSLILTVCGGYHGDTLGAMSVCDPINGMHGLFSGVLPRQIFAPRPECRFDAPFQPSSLEPVERLFAENTGRIAAVIIEPIVQGAGGMWFYHPQYLAGLRELCDRHGALLILDEIATGFGRTGKMFACEWAGIEPDIMCVGKALTGGVMTLAATLASRKVAHGISRSGGVLMHGPTFMGNPLACAVAGASLKLLADFPWQEKVTEMEALMKEMLSPCAGLDGVADVRVLGGIGVVEMERAVNVEALQDFFVREHRVWIRPFGKLIYMMPPYVVSQAELARLCRAVADALEKNKWV